MIRYLIFFAFLSLAHADENCSRIAIVNYQQVLVDTGSTGKGEAEKTIR